MRPSGQRFGSRTLSSTKGHPHPMPSRRFPRLLLARPLQILHGTACESECASLHALPASMGLGNIDTNLEFDPWRGLITCPACRSATRSDL